MFGWGGRPSRNQPAVDYNEDTSSEEDLPFVSPKRPSVTRAGSPQLLAVPQLSDNVDEDLEQVSQTLRNIGHTELFRPSKGEEEALETEEVTEEGFVAGSASVENKEDNMPDDANVEVDFEDENGVDGAKALEHTRTLNIEYNPKQVEFWFTQIENEMYTCEVKSQWLKRCVLVKNLPASVQSDVMSLLVLKKSEMPDDLYKQIKVELLRIHAPKCEENFKRALTRVLVGLPSQLGQQLISDICDKNKKLTGCCCAKAVYCLWCLQLPVAVRSQVANMEFNATTFNAVFQAADKIFLSTKTTELSASVAAVVATPSQQTEEVAAFKPARNKNQNQNRGNRNRNQTQSQGKNQSQSQGKNKGQGRGTRHSSSPPSSCCDNHFRWGPDSWFCLEPTSCPWKDKCVPRPTTEKK